MSPKKSRREPSQPPGDPFQQEARYRIAAVAELTGVPEPTLRAWERRYGIPMPARTASGYRLYSVEDVRKVRELRRLSEDGIAAAEAAKIVLGESSPPAGRDARAGLAGDGFTAAVDAILDAVEGFDSVALDQQLRRLMFLGSVTDVLDRVLLPALGKIGDRWHAGELGVGQEHFATFKLGTVMRDLLRLLPGGDVAGTVVLASFAEDDHELGLLGVAVRISQWGLRPLFLGARTPPSAVRSAVAAVSPILVALSVTVTPSRPRARELVEDYAAACGNVPWVVGGPGSAGIADLVKAKGGTLLVDAEADLRAAIEPLLSSAPPPGSKGDPR